MDYDGDGMVTASEYSDYANETTGVSEPMSEEDWNDFVAMFSYMDTNSDGGMDLEELSAMMGSMDDDDERSPPMVAKWPVLHLWFQDVLHPKFQNILHIWFQVIVQPMCA